MKEEAIKMYILIEILLLGVKVKENKLNSDSRRAKGNN